MKTPDTDASRLLIEHARLTHKILRKADGQLSMHGISFTEFLIMQTLNQAPTKTMRRIELAEAVGITASGVTRLLAPMEKNRLVEKEANPRDARVSLVKLSATGERLYSEAAVSFDYCAATLTESLKPAQVQKVIELNRLMLG